MDQAYDYYDAVVNNDINRAERIKKALPPSFWFQSRFYLVTSFMKVS